MPPTMALWSPRLGAEGRRPAAVPDSFGADPAVVAVSCGGAFSWAPATRGAQRRIRLMLVRFCLASRICRFRVTEIRRAFLARMALTCRPIAA